MDVAYENPRVGLTIRFPVDDLRMLTQEQISELSDVVFEAYEKKKQEILARKPS